MHIAVYCGSSRRIGTPYTTDARRVGEAIARAGHVLVYGGGRTGLMGEVADGALSAGGVVEGIILDRFVADGVHHTGLTALHQVDDMRKRKQGLEERAQAFIALPGGLGTLEEVTEVLSFRKLGFHSRRLVLLNTNGFFDSFVAQLERGVDQGFDDASVRQYVSVTDDPEIAVSRCSR